MFWQPQQRDMPSIQSIRLGLSRRFTGHAPRDRGDKPRPAPCVLDPDREPELGASALPDPAKGAAGLSYVAQLWEPRPAQPRLDAKLVKEWQTVEAAPSKSKIHPKGEPRLAIADT